MVRAIAPTSRFERVLEALWPGLALRRAIQRMGIEEARGYDAARQGRRTAGWIAGGGSANEEIGQGLARTRNRARDTVRNNEYAKRAVGVYSANVVSYGITLTPENAGERADWKAWTESLECDATGDDNFNGLLRLAVEGVAFSALFPI